MCGVCWDKKHTSSFSKDADIDFGENELLDELESSKEYKAYKKEVADAIKDQRNDLLLSGIVVMAYRKFWHLFKKDPKTKKAPPPMKKKTRKKLFNYLQQATEKYSRSVAGYEWFKGSTKDYLLGVMTVGGQSILDAFGVQYTFNLTHPEYKRKVFERATTLIKGLDKTTSKRFANQILKGLEKGETREQIAKRLTKLAPSVSKSRANIIVRTETVAAVEYMKQETALRNGVKTKTRRITNDESTCPICRPMADITVPIEKTFPNVSLYHPPVHPSCRCRVEYDFNNIEYTEFLRSWDDELDFKKGKKYIYNTVINDYPIKVFNPQAVWTGSKKLSGKDSKITVYFDKILSIGKDSFKQDWKNISFSELYRWAESTKWIDNIDTTKFRYAINTDIKDVTTRLELMPLTDIQLLLVSAKNRLTEWGFVQLLKGLGYKWKVPKEK